MAKTENLKSGMSGQRGSLEFYVTRELKREPADDEGQAGGNPLQA
jgi:hypothetical protein